MPSGSLRSEATAPGVVQVAGGGVGRAGDADAGTLVPVHPDQARRDPEPAHGLRQPVVVGEDDDLPVPGHLLQHPGEAVNLRRVHGLHRVVDDHEPERAGWRGRLGQEQVELEYQPLLSYAVVHNGVPPGRQLSVRTTDAVGSPSPPSTSSRSRAPAGRDLAARLPCRVLAHNEWFNTPGLRDLLAAFVQPNTGAVEGVLRAASRILLAHTGSGSLQGYQAGSDRVVQIAGFIWPDHRDPVTWTGFRRTAPAVTGTSTRSHPQEIANALCRAARIPLPEAELLRTAMELLGYRRRTEKIEARLRSGLRHALDLGRIRTGTTGRFELLGG